MKVYRVAPIGKRKAIAFVCARHGGAGPRSVEEEVYPEASVARGRAFRDERLRRGHSLFEAARLLSVSPVQLSSLERGEATLSEDDWAVALETLS